MPQLKPLLEKAMRQSPRILDRQLDLADARADGYVARASSRPHVGGYLQYQFQREKRANVYSSTTQTYGDSISQNEKLYYNFSVTQSVWEWGALSAARRIARIDEDLASLNYGEAYRALAAELRANYMALVLAKMATRNVAYSQQLAEESLTREQARFDSNQTTRGNVMESELRVDETTLAAERAQADLEYLLGNFRLLCGDADFSESDVPDQIADVSDEPDLAESEDEPTSEEQARIRAAEKEVEKCKLGLVAPRFALFPKLALVGGVSRDEISRDLDAYKKYQTDTWYAGAQINWTIFDGLSSKGRRLAAYTRLRRAEQRLANMRVTSARDRNREAQNVMFSWTAYKNAKLRLRMARERHAYTKALADRGEASQEQVESMQTALNNQLYATQQALAAYLNANVQYLSARGLDPLGKPAVQH